MKIVLFDIDGTLIKAGGAGLRGLNRAIKKMCGVDDICSRFRLQGSTDKENFRTAFIKASGKKPTARQVRELERLYLSCLPEEVELSVKSGNYLKIKGAEKLLKALSGRKDVMVGLGTGNLKAGAVIKLKPSGLARYFAFGGYGCDSHIRSRMLMKAVQRAGKLLKRRIGPADVYVIGDTHKDVEAAREAGYHCAGVTCGFGEAAALRRSGPELLAEDFSDIRPWLLWLGLKKDPKGVRRASYIFPVSPVGHSWFSGTGLELDEMEGEAPSAPPAKRPGRGAKRTAGKKERL